MINGYTNKSQRKSLTDTIHLIRQEPETQVNHQRQIWIGGHLTKHIFRKEGQGKHQYDQMKIVSSEPLNDPDKFRESRLHGFVPMQENT